MKKYMKNIQNSQLTRVRIADSWLTMTNGNSLYYINIANYDDEDESVARYYTIKDLENATIRKNKARLESQDSHEELIDYEKVWDGYQQHYEKETTMKVAYTTPDLEQLVKTLKAANIENVLLEIPKGDYPTRITSLGKNSLRCLLVSIYDNAIKKAIERESKC